MLAHRLSPTLAQPNRRKLALLIGINQYPASTYGNSSLPLAGCVADVALQRELLIHRFGFAPDDVLTLTDRQATRSQIQAAFYEHLQAQAQPDDPIIFHFSGLGSRCELPNDPDRLQNTLVPVDATFNPKDGTTIGDLPEETLWLMLRSLPTSNVITILDTSYTYPGTALQGNLRIRSRPFPTTAKLTDAELVLQGQLRRSAIANNRLTNPRQIPGVLLAAGNGDRLAAEVRWQGFTAGLLTYALTQHLWRASPNTGRLAIVGQVARTTEQVAGREHPPLFCTGTIPPCASSLSPESHPTDTLPLLPDAVGPGADGVVLGADADPDIVQVWLGGLPARVLEAYGANSVLALSTDSNLPPIALQVRSRNETIVKAQRLNSENSISSSSFQPEQLAGQFVREWIRVIPRNPSLTVALDSTLARIERVDATSALSSLRYIYPVVAGEQAADCLFGRVQRATIASSLDRPNPLVNTDRGSYGLFSLAQELIPSSCTMGDEAIKTAVQRLVPHLEMLRAEKLLHLTENETSSRLAVKASLILVDREERSLLERQTQAMENTRPILETSVRLPTSSRIRYRIQNASDRPIYFLMFGFDREGRASIFYPLDSGVDRTQLAIAPGATATFPPEPDRVWQTSSTPGSIKVQTLVSDRPFQTTREVLEEVRALKSSGFETVSHPIDIARAIVLDLHQASLPATANLELSKEVFALDVNAWTTLNLSYEVISG